MNKNIDRFYFHYELLFSKFECGVWGFRACLEALFLFQVLLYSYSKKWIAKHCLAAFFFVIVFSSGIILQFVKEHYGMKGGEGICIVAPN